jgi:hypothetical protein
MSDRINVRIRKSDFGIIASDLFGLCSGENAERG